jgi:hypothetical protein
MVVVCSLLRIGGEGGAVQLERTANASDRHLAGLRNRLLQSDSSAARELPKDGDTAPQLEEQGKESEAFSAAFPGFSVVAEAAPSDEVRQGGCGVVWRTTGARHGSALRGRTGMSSAAQASLC